jgi:hypothetical protein
MHSEVLPGKDLPATLSWSLSLGALGAPGCSTPVWLVHPESGPSSHSSPFPLSLSKCETISFFHRGSMAGRLMNLSPAPRPACQKCLQCIQRSPRWAAGGTIRHKKNTELLSQVPSSGYSSRLTPSSTAEMIFHLQFLVCPF